MGDAGLGHCLRLPLRRGAMGARGVHVETPSWLLVLFFGAAILLLVALIVILF